jgi:hypothetical protein
MYSNRFYGGFTMAAVEFWAEGFPGTYPAATCPQCGGNIWPMKKPDPDLDCTWCCGMGGGLALLSGCPYAVMPILTFRHLMNIILGFESDSITVLGKIHPAELIWRISSNEKNIDLMPDIHDAAELLEKLRDVASFAKDVDVDVVWA